MESNNRVVTSLKSCLNRLSSNTTVSEAEEILHTISTQLKLKPGAALEVIENLFSPKSSQFLHLIQVNSGNEEFLQCVLQSVDDIMNCPVADLQPNTGSTLLEAYEAIGDLVLSIQYTNKIPVITFKNPTSILLACIAILNKVSSRCPSFVQLHISAILGIAKANINYGLESIKTKPQKIIPNQTVYCDSSTEEFDGANEADSQARWNGGKVSKKRKPRALAKSMQNQQQNQHQSRHQSLELDKIIYCEINAIRTSDSEASEVDLPGSDNTFHRTYNAQDRQRHAKVRYAAIGLLGSIVTRVQERRLLYGYWHAFFENSKVQNSNDQRLRKRSDLLYVGQHDPNTRCRALALQVAAQLIFSSKNFLQQAECATERCPTSFLPFGYSLGLQVLSLFEELTKILTNDSSVPVLTQALKCLAVLVQASTPFKRFEPRNFVAPFVRQVQRLVQHRDATIQVAALMVIEFLIATPDLTLEISSAIGFPYNSRNISKEQRLKDENAADLLELDNTFEEFIESDEDNLESQNIESKNIVENKTENISSEKYCRQSWLLQKVFLNLSNFQCSGAEATKPILLAASVRIASLQLLAALAQHFTFLQSELNCVAISIENSLKMDQQSDLRICAARCLDTIAYQIGRTLLESASGASAGNEFLEHCTRFWSQILPTTLTYICMSESEAAVTVKVCLCDALSNIGVIVFERQPHTQQMNLIGFLSGIASAPNEEVAVRSAAIRALAVYVLFPSLRENLVFVENAADLALRLVDDANVMVRVKALWALGNISDALLLNIGDSNIDRSMPERIADDLLWRLIKAATEACSDNDKVRCNAVRTLGNLLRLLNASHFDVHCIQNKNNRACFLQAINKLNDCLRAAGSAKVKWNTCYAIGNLLQNSELFNIHQLDCDWQSKLYPTLANVIVNHPNFKVRINATTALTRISARSHFGSHFPELWSALVDAIEQSHHLDNFYEYNHRDHLQEQLCMAISHLLRFVSSDDFNILRAQLEPRAEVVRSTWIRVVNRIVPERSAPLVACSAFLRQQWNNKSTYLNSEQRNDINFITDLFEIK